MKQKTDEKTIGGTVSEAIKAIKGKYGSESIMRMSDQPHVALDRIPTGSVGLDIALGIGGLPRGRMIEILGPESSGKTTLALHVIAEAQKLNAKSECAYIDVEHAMDPTYARQIGVNTDKLFISQPDSAEQALDMVESMIRSNGFDVVVVDSVAALTPKSEIEGEMGDQQMGKQARLMGQAMRKLTAIGAKSKTVVIFINQIRMQLNAMPGTNPETTPGGKALKFYSSVRLDIRRIAQIKKADEVVGGRVRVKVIKNKVGPPFKQTEFDLMYGEGISPQGELLALGEKFKIVQKAGASYSYGEIKLGRGYDASRQFLKGNTDISEKILAEIRAKFDKDSLFSAPAEVEGPEEVPGVIPDSN